MSSLILLDTHVWFWLMEGHTRLGRPARKAIQEAVPSAGLRISAISIWEIGMLEAKGRLIFRRDCLAWVDDALQAPGFSLVPLSPAIALASTRLPGGFHGDPADRILAATARDLGACLITADETILAYGSAGHLKTLAA